MKDPGEVAGAMGTPLARLERAGRAVALVLVIVTASMTVIYVDRFVAAVTALPDAWQTGLWGFFGEPAAIMLAAAPLNLIRPWGLVAASRRASAAVFTARTAAIAGDAELAPPATEQPDPQPPDDPTPALAVIGPLRRSAGSTAATQLTVCIVLLIVGGFLMITAVVILFTVPGSNTKTIGLLVFVAVAAGCIVVALLLALAWRRERWVMVRADDTGLTWTTGRLRRGQVHAGWHEIQAFVKVRFPTTQDKWDETFALDVRSVVLAWSVKSTSSECEQEAHALLSGLIARHTALRLRDLTDAIEKLDQPVSQPRARATPTISLGEVRAVAGVPALASAKLSRSVPWSKVALTLTLPALLLAGTGWALQQYRPHYYEGLDARIHAERPLYSDPLAVADGDWLVQQSTESDPRMYTYNSHAYQLSGKDASQFMDARLTRTFGDVAVEVTVRQIGADQGNDGVGLELRGGEHPYRMVVFMVDSSGVWWLWSYKNAGGSPDSRWELGNNPGNQWDLIAVASSRAIHIGPQQSNRLLVVAHGNEFLCYINETFVGDYTMDDASASGYVGVYLNESTMTGVFSHFAVYPVKPATPFLL